MKIENICNFYASNYHLSVVLYEYLRKNSRKEVVTFFESGIEEEIKMLEDKKDYHLKAQVNFNKNINIENRDVDVLFISITFSSFAFAAICSK